MLLGISLLLTVLTVFCASKWEMLTSWFSSLRRRPSHEPLKAPGNNGAHTQTNNNEKDDEDTKEDVYIDRDEYPEINRVDSAESTPKVKATMTAPNVPSFDLHAPIEEEKEEDSSEDEDDGNMPPPSFPAMNSAQRASGGGSRSMGPPTLKPLSGAGSMPPPPLPSLSSARNNNTNNLRTPPSAASSLRVPSSGPLPNRGPPRMSGLSAPSTLSPNPRKPPTSTNARNKVILTPGHSPLDWATLQKSGTNLSGVPSFTRVPPSLLKEMNGRKGKPAWTSYQGKVYNITPYLPFHPGGEGELKRCAGKDGEKLFLEVHSWVNWENMLDGCFVGMLVADREVAGNGNAQSGGSAPMIVKSKLEDID